MILLRDTLPPTVRMNPSTPMPAHKTSVRPVTTCLVITTAMRYNGFGIARRKWSSPKATVLGLSPVDCNQLAAIDAWPILSRT